MSNLGFFELTLFGIIALIVLGPEKLPTAARTVGKWYGKFRRMSARLQSEFVSELQLLEVQEELKSELAKLRESESQMKAQMAKLQHSLNQTTSLPVDAHQDTQHQRIADDSNTNSEQPPANSHDTEHTSKVTSPKLVANIPMTNRWFLLGSYDKNRRLPRAPFLPNYQADPLLSTSTVATFS